MGGGGGGGGGGSKRGNIEDGLESDKNHRGCVTVSLSRLVDLGYDMHVQNM